MDARKQRIDTDEAWERLKTAKSVTIAKGKKVLCFNRVADEKAAILQQAMGPSGNLRAPTFRDGTQVIIGFNPQLYGEWLN